MFDLCIYDVSAFVHQGAASDAFKSRFYYNYPVGGMHYLMRYVTSALVVNDSVILAFDGRNNFRKELFSDYKIGRVQNKSVISQLDTLYEELSGCGFSTYKYDGFEGDDIIAWAVQQNYSKFNAISIYGNDRDLLHNVHGKVAFRSITKSINSVTESNFAYAIEKGKNIPFNTISFYKVLCGCTSDKIPAFKSEKGYSGQQLFSVLIKAMDYNKVPFIYENTTNADLFMTILTKLNLITEADVVELRKRFILVCPAACPDSITITPDSIRTIDQKAFNYFLSKYNDINSLRCMEYRTVPLLDADVQQVRKKAYDLSSGAVAVDKQINVHDVDEIGQCLFMKEF